MSKKDYRVRNWREYNQALVKRGSITVWLDENILKHWYSNQKELKRGRPEKYSDIAMVCALTIKAFYKLSFRGTQGFISSLMKHLNVKMDTPSYTLLCKRQRNLKVDLPKKRTQQEGIHMVVDTTGLKVFGEGEWKVRQHGWVKHRLWRKLHIAVNRQTQEIEAFELTDLGIQDCEGFSMLVEKIEVPIASAIGDGTYDRFSCYETAEQHRFQMISPPQRNARTSRERSLNKKKASTAAVRKRDEAIEQVRELGRKEWKVRNGYHRRSLAETAIFRIKTLLGNKLTTKKMENQMTEIAIWCRVINRMTALGMPKSIAL